MSDHRSEPDWIARARAAGYKITPATRDDFPEPEYTLPSRRAALLLGIRRALRRLLPRSKADRVPHVPVH
ncbi:hypothetical protein [Longimicrobium sp.]|uniref:hypothetical protein n=1 Tax=Longimicrobium sp. TaxID=2029185 RepID=UPI002C0FF932|nr:hypothetical protein [Longimicrobium sp.]HSU12997.1 hypothetical protein [Longimicrobium sp.]